MNNPIRFIDPDGMGVDDYKLDKDGNISLIKKTNDKYDVVYATDENGNVDQNNSIKVDKEVIENKRTNTIQVPTDETDANGDAVNKDVNLNEYEIKNYGKAKEFFEFMTNNSNVEWGHNIVGNSHRSIITTTHEKLYEAGGGYLLLNGYTLNERRHSHHYNKVPSPADKNNVQDSYKRKFPNMLFYIYYKEGYYQYDEKGLIPNQ